MHNFVGASILYHTKVEVFERVNVKRIQLHIAMKQNSQGVCVSSQYKDVLPV